MSSAYDRRRVLLAVSITTLASFVTGLNARLALVGFPIVARELGAGIDGMLWIIQGFMIGSTILQLIVGRLADLYGRVRLFNLGFLIFSIAGLVAGLSTSWVMLSIARIIQGLGAAFLTSLSITILADNIPSSMLATWLGVNQIAWRAGATLGLTISGFIIDFLGWRWLYLVYVPIGFAALFASLNILRDVYRPPTKPCVDIGGFILFTAFVLTLLIYLTLALRETPSVSLVATSLLFLALFIAWELRSSCKALDFSVFRRWQFVGGIVAHTLYVLGFGSSLTLLVLLFQVAKGFSASTTGLNMIPFELSFLVFGVVGGRLSDKLGFVAITTAGLGIASVSLYMLSRLVYTDSLTEILVITVLLGIGAGLFVAPNTSSIVTAVEPEKRGVASALRTLSFNLGFLASLNMAFLILASFIPYQLASTLIILGESALDNPGLSTKLVDALSAAFAAQAVFMAAAIPFSLSRSGSRKTEHG